jgi:hypothetical protein
MELHWKYNPNTKIAKAIVNEELYYETPDGGQTINKYVNGEFVRAFHKYGEDKKFTNYEVTSNHLGYKHDLDEWNSEITWLANTYSNEVGSIHMPWTDGYINSRGVIEDVGITRGYGVNNTEDKQAVNRMGLSCKVQEWWGWDLIAYSTKELDNCHGFGLVWRKNKQTNEIVRVGGGQPQVPCCVYPVIHGPWTVDDSDIELHEGVRY